MARVRESLSPQAAVFSGVRSSRPSGRKLFVNFTKSFLPDPYIFGMGYDMQGDNLN